MTKEEFSLWVDTMVKNIDYKRYSAYRFDTTVICYDKKTRKVGVAMCHPDDNFNMSIGKAIAYARCKGYSIPNDNSSLFVD